LVNLKAVNKALREGVEAYLNGYKRHANPYHNDDENWIFWDQAWLQAFDEENENDQ